MITSSDLPQTDRLRAVEGSGQFLVAGVGLTIESDEQGVIDEFRRLFGCDSAVDEPLYRLHATIIARAEDFGTIHVTGDDLPDGASFLLGFASAAIPLVPFPSEPGTRAVAYEGDSRPLFVFRGGDGRFRKVPRWRRIVSHFLFLRILRMRKDLLFFHAASLAIDESGVLLVGPKGSGKTTLAGAIAARGYDLFGDETAAYRSVDGAIIPMRRSLSIKPGLRSRAVDSRLGQIRNEADEDGIWHVPAAVLGECSRSAAPLRAVVFLEPYGAAPRLEPTDGGRDALAALQPIRSASFVEAPSRQVFAMIRMLSSVQCYRLHAGDPDRTAELLIEVIRSHDTHRQRQG